MQTHCESSLGTNEFRVPPLEIDRWKKNLHAAYVGQTDRIKTRRSLPESEELLPPIIGIHEGIQVNRMEPVKTRPHADEVVLVDTPSDRSVPNRGPTYLLTVSVSFN